MTINRQILLLSQLHQRYIKDDIKHLEVDKKTGQLKNQNCIKRIFTNFRYGISSDTEALKDRKVRDLTKKISEISIKPQDIIDGLTEEDFSRAAYFKKFITNVALSQDINNKIKQELAPPEGFDQISEYDIDNMRKKLNGGLRTGILRLSEAETTQLNLVIAMDTKIEPKTEKEKALFTKCASLKEHFNNFNLSEAAKLHKIYKKQIKNVTQVMDKEGSMMIQASIEQMQYAHALMVKLIPYPPKDSLELSKILACILNGRDGIDKITNPECFKINETADSAISKNADSRWKASDVPQLTKSPANVNPSVGVPPLPQESPDYKAVRVKVENDIAMHTLRDLGFG
jgi:hypothetical protein